MLVQGNFAPLFRRGLRKDFRDNYEEFERQYPKFLKTTSTDVPEQRASIIAGLNRLYEIGDGEPITYDIPKMGPVVQGIDREFGVGFALTKKTVEDDQYGKANQAAKWLGHAVNMTFEFRSGAFLDDAFTGSTFLGIDSLSLCHTSHTLIGSTSTVANRPSTEVAFSMAGITQLMDLAGLMKDENGDPIVMWPNKVIIGNNAGNINKAIQIFGSDKEPFTADNQDNAIKKRIPRPEVVISRYMNSQTRYFMVDDKWNDAWFVTRRAPTYEDDFDFNTGAMLNKVTTRFLIWFVDWRGWLGANPT